MGRNHLSVGLVQQEKLAACLKNLVALGIHEMATRQMLLGQRRAENLRFIAFYSPDWSMDDFALFQKFARTQRNAEALDTSTGEENVRLFEASLQSARALMKWTGSARNPRHERFAIILGFIDRMTPNAVAGLFEGTYFAGMHTALFVAINEFADFCFTQSGFFPDIGDPAKETSPKPVDERVPGLWLLDHTLSGGSITRQHSEMRTPRDDDRYLASIYLAQLMARFVWLHELAHCFNGHVSYVQNKNIALHLNELAEGQGLVSHSKAASPEEQGDTDKILKCVELDADQSAFWASCRIQLDDLENMEGIRAYDLKTRMRMTLFGAYAMTWLFDEFQKYLDARNEITHPAPYIRLQTMLRTANSNVAPLHPDFADWHHDACGQFDTIRKAIPGMYRTDELHSALLDENAQEVSSFEQRLQELKDELAAFQYSEKQG